MADGIFYRDTKPPFIGAALLPISVTLSTTDKALVTASSIPYFGPQYFSYIGKKIHVRLFGTITTAATPGNGTFAVYYGTGADANGVLLASSAAHVLLATQTTQSWSADFMVHCRSTGSTGTLFVTGTCDFTPAVSAAGGGLIPAATPVVSAACDLTAALVVNLQFKRSGSTAETMIVHDMEYEALN